MSPKHKAKLRQNLVKARAVLAEKRAAEQLPATDGSAYEPLVVVSLKELEARLRAAIIDVQDVRKALEALL